MTNQINPSPAPKKSTPWWESFWTFAALGLAAIGSFSRASYHIGISSTQQIRFECQVIDDEVVCKLPQSDRPHELVFDRIPLKTIGGSSDE